MDNKPDIDVDALVEELKADGYELTKEEAGLAVERLAELLLLISAPLPLPPARSTKQEELDQSLLQAE